VVHVDAIRSRIARRAPPPATATDLTGAKLLHLGGACRRTRQDSSRRKTKIVNPKNGLSIAGQTVLYRGPPCWRATLIRASGIDGEAVDGEAVDGEAVDGEAVDGEAVDGEAVDGAAQGRAGCRGACPRTTPPGQRTQLR
jgi:hypothetical protein